MSNLSITTITSGVKNGGILYGFHRFLNRTDGGKDPLPSGGRIVQSFPEQLFRFTRRADPAIYQIACRGGNRQSVNDRDQDKGQLGMNCVQKSRQQGTDDAAKRLGRVVKSHDQILLGRIRPGRHHVLQYGDADGISGKGRL